MGEENRQKVEEMSEKPPSRGRPADHSWGIGDLFSNRPFIISALYICTYFTGISCFVGVVLAYVFADAQAEDWEQSHYTYLIRTFWLLVVGCLLCVAIGLTLTALEFEVIGLALGLLSMLGLFVVTAVRTVFSMLNSARKKPMPRPRTFWI